MDVKWSSNFAYALGLLATDGYVSKDGRHIVLVSKDKDQLENFNLALKISNPIARHHSGSGGVSFRCQFSDVYFHGFLQGVGITNAKSKTIKSVKVPDEYFFDFLRGCFDGDGYVYSYWDKRWRSSFMFYLGFASASLNFINWIRSELAKRLEVKGHITKSKGKSCYQLKYAKKESTLVLKTMYHKKGAISLRRKKLKVDKIFAMVTGKTV
ncbi:MAG: LAGLIDADG family homing endonuclease [Candidatus Pacebacteria bacterium]|nr:LAGLIDADG family homing endonuclease [Candidatus Paceibacterota bacterium]